MRLTAREISAVLAAAGNADVGAMAEECEIEKESQKFLAAFESGMEKLRKRLAELERAEIEAKERVGS